MDKLDDLMTKKTAWGIAIAASLISSAITVIIFSILVFVLDV